MASRGLFKQNFTWICNFHWEFGHDKCSVAVSLILAWSEKPMFHPKLWIDAEIHLDLLHAIRDYFFEFKDFGVKTARFNQYFVVVMLFGNDSKLGITIFVIRICWKSHKIIIIEFLFTDLVWKLSRKIILLFRITFLQFNTVFYHQDPFCFSNL